MIWELKYKFLKSLSKQSEVKYFQDMDDIECRLMSILRRIATVLFHLSPAGIANNKHNRDFNSPEHFLDAFQCL